MSGVLNSGPDICVFTATRGEITVAAWSTVQLVGEIERAQAGE
jgi:hypothetical protein